MFRLAGISLLCLQLSFTAFTVHAIPGNTQQAVIANPPAHSTSESGGNIGDFQSLPVSENDTQGPEVMAVLEEFLGTTKDNRLPLMDYVNKMIRVYDSTLEGEGSIRNVLTLWSTIYWTAMQLPARPEDKQQDLLDLALATRNSSAHGGRGRALAEYNFGYRFWWDLPFWQEGFRIFEVLAPGIHETPAVFEYQQWSGFDSKLLAYNKTLTYQQWANLNSFMSKLNKGVMEYSIRTSMATLGQWWLAENLETYQSAAVLNETLPVTYDWLASDASLIRWQLVRSATFDFRQVSPRQRLWLDTEDDVPPNVPPGLDDMLEGEYLQRPRMDRDQRGAFRGAPVHNVARWTFWQDALTAIEKREDLVQEVKDIAAAASDLMIAVDRCQAGMRSACTKQYYG